MKDIFLHCLLQEAWFCCYFYGAFVTAAGVEIGLVKLREDSLTKWEIVVAHFPAPNLAAAEVNQCQEEGVAGCCSLLFIFLSFFSLFFPPVTCNSLFYYNPNYLLRF